MSNIIKKYRLSAGLTLEQLGKLVGVKKSAVWKWENGQKPSPQATKLLEKVTNGKLSREAIRPDVYGGVNDA
jgi:transcriptional regulator with XRE-family HTH domain